MTHKMLVDSKSGTTTKDRELVLKADELDEEDDEISLIARRFEKYVRSKFKGKTMKGKNNSGTSRTSSSTGCFKCGEVEHRIKECQQWKSSKGNSGNEGEKKVFKKAMLAAVWGNTDSDEEDEDEEANLCQTAITSGDQS